MTLKYQELLNKPFNHGVQDCYSVVRDFYKINYDMDLTDYARADNWWSAGEDLYMENFGKEGFQLASDNMKEWLPGDVILMAIGASVACHAAIWLGEGNKIVHHFYNRLSNIETYRGIWKSQTVAVVRHPSVEKIWRETDAKRTYNLFER